MYIRADILWPMIQPATHSHPTCIVLILGSKALCPIYNGPDGE